MHKSETFAVLYFLPGCFIPSAKQKNEKCKKKKRWLARERVRAVSLPKTSYFGVYLHRTIIYERPP